MSDPLGLTVALSNGQQVTLPPHDDFYAQFTTRTVDNHILRLRKHIEPDPENPKYILTIRGAGYRFDATVRPGL